MHWISLLLFTEFMFSKHREKKKPVPIILFFFKKKKTTEARNKNVRKLEIIVAASREDYSDKPLLLTTQGYA